MGLRDIKYKGANENFIKIGKVKGEDGPAGQDGLDGVSSSRTGEDNVFNNNNFPYSFIEVEMVD